MDDLLKGVRIQGSLANLRITSDVIGTSLQAGDDEWGVGMKQ
jgi:hypothetical protein